MSIDGSCAMAYGTGLGGASTQGGMGSERQRFCRSPRCSPLPLPAPPPPPAGLGYGDAKEDLDLFVTRNCN